MSKAQSRRQFGRLPYEIVDRGGMIHLGASEMRVYLALLIGANANGVTCPSLATLARRAGCSTRTVSRVVSKLASKGFIELAKGGGRGRSSTYSINENHDTLSVTLLDPQTTTPRVSTFVGNKPRHPDTNTTTSSDLNHDRFELNHDTLDVSLTEEQIEQTEQRAASPPAAAVVEVDDRKTQAIAALTAAGIGEPSRSRLASRGIITAAMVAKVIADLGTTAGPGLIVRAVTEHADRDEQTAVDKAKREQAQAERERVRIEAVEALESEHKAKAKEHRAEVDAWWAGLDATEKRRRTEAGIPSPHPCRRRMDGEHTGICPEAGRSAPLVYLAWKNWREVQELIANRITHTPRTGPIQGRSSQS